MRMERFNAMNPNDFVHQLRNTAFIPQESVKAYMQNFKRWAFIIDQRDLSCESPDHFVRDLIRFGYLRIDGDQYYLDMQRSIVPFEPTVEKQLTII